MVVVRAVLRCWLGETICIHYCQVGKRRMRLKLRQVEVINNHFSGKIRKWRIEIKGKFGNTSHQASLQSHTFLKFLVRSCESATGLRCISCFLQYKMF